MSRSLAGLEREDPCKEEVKAAGESLYLALHVLRLLGAHVCGSFKVQHGLALFLLILGLVLHLQRGTDAGQTPCTQAHTLYIDKIGVLHYPR